MLKLNYKPSDSVEAAVKDAWRKTTRNDMKRFSCPLTGNDVLAHGAETIALQLHENPSHMSFTTFEQPLLDRFRQYVQSTQTPMVLDIDSCTSPDFQFVLAYTLSYGSRAADFMNYAKRSASLQQLTTQLRIIWTDDWFNETVSYEGRQANSFVVDYTELAKFFWFMAGRTTSTDFLLMYQYNYVRAFGSTPSIYTVIEPVYRNEAATMNGDLPRYSNNGNSLQAEYGTRLLSRAWIPVPTTDDWEGWLRSLVTQYHDKAHNKFLVATVGIQEYNDRNQRFLYRHEKQTREA